MTGRQLGRQVAVGTAWSIALRWGIRGIGVISTVIYVRLLTPADFGLAAMAMLVVGFVEVLRQTGQSLALIRHPHPTREHYDTAWTIQVATGAIVTATILLAAPLATLLFDDPRVVNVIRVMGLRALIGGFENIGVVDFQRDLKFHLEFRYMIGQRIGTFLITTATAVALRNYWALVAGLVGGQSVGVALSYLLNPTRPRLSLSRFRELASFSIWTFVGYMGQILNERSDEIAVGNLIGTVGLGFYHIAADTGTSLVLEILNPINRTIYSAYARLLDHRELLKLAYLDVLSIVATIAISIAVGLQLVASDLVLVLFGPRWMPSAPLLGWLAAAGGFFGLIMSVVTLLVVVGEVQFSAYLIWLRVALLIPATWLAGWHAGAEGVAIARTLVLVVSTPVMLLALRRIFPLSLRELGDQIWRPAVASGCMVVAVSALHPWLPEIPLIRLAAETSLGALAFGASLLCLWWLTGRPAGFERRAIDLIMLFGARGRQAG